MALDKTRLVLDPTFDNNEGQRGSIFLDPRGQTRDEIVAGSLTPPINEGALRVERTDDQQLCRLLCSIETSEGVYEWKNVQVITSYVDSRTGRDWDQNAGFIYSYTR